MQQQVFKRLLKRSMRFGSYWKKGLALLLVATICDVAGPYLVKVYIDSYLTEGVWFNTSVSSLLGLYVSALLVGGWCHYRQSRIFSFIALKVIERLRVDTYESILARPVAYYDHHSTGAIVSRLTNDSEAVKDLFLHVLSTILQNGSLVLGIFIMMAVLDLRLMLLAAIMLPLIGLAMWGYQRLSTPLFQKVRALLADINSQLHEALNGMTIIQSLNQELQFQERFSDVVDRFLFWRTRNVTLDGLMLRALVDALSMLTLAGIVLAFGLASIEETVQIGVLYAFISYLGRFVEPLIEITQRLNIMQQSLVSADRVFQLLDETPEDYRGSKGITRGRVEVQNLHFSYDQQSPVLKGISLTIEPGTMLGIVGRTGSGKSTLAQLMLRLYPASEGAIRIDEHPLAELHADALRKDLCIVEQDPFLFRGTLAENLTLGASAQESDMIDALRQAGLGRLLLQLPNGLHTLLGERGARLSSGERHLLALARALLRRPRILILDEATATVDSETEYQVQQSIEQLKGQVTLIVIAHRLATIRSADNIAVLHHGALVEQGSHAALMQEGGLYAQLYQIQSAHFTAE